MREYVEYLQPVLLFGALGAILLQIAKSCGFFRLPLERDRRSNPVSLKVVSCVFVIYLGMTLIAAPVMVHIARAFYTSPFPLAAFGWIQLLALSGIFILFYLYSKAHSPILFKRIWKDRSIPQPRSIPIDFLMGVLTWIIGFPIVIAVGQFADALLYFFFGFESYEQVAVRYLKTTLGSPSMLAVALFTILIAAPLIEEFLFRGCLQTFFKRHMATKNAIILSALCFAVFHFSTSQGIGNISLVASLFSFALFLGFIYERQASLFASVGLHMTFNAVSTFRILFFPE